MTLDDALPTFIVESRELLEDIEARLLGGAASAKDPEAPNAIFRAAHTIKGSAGLFQLDHIVKFTHGVESVLDAVRDGRVPLDDELVALLLECADHLGALINAVAGGNLAASEESEWAALPLQERLAAYLGGNLPGVAKPHEGLVWFSEAPSSGDAEAQADLWHISLRFGRDVLRNGMDPLSFIRYLETIGTIAGIVTLTEAIPPAAEMDPESCYLGFEIAFRSAADKAAIEGVFEFVRDDCRIRILPPRSRVAEYVELLESLPEEAPRLGELLVRCGALTPHELEAALAAQRASPVGGVKLGEVLVREGMVQPAAVDAALVKQKRVVEARQLEGRSVRVDAEKLDSLIDLIGELIIAAESASLVARKARIAELQESTATLSSLVEEVRESALQLRMVKIGATFNRFQRVVHDVSRELGKSIQLHVSGEDTELDKTVVERIADPLTHLVRNAMDHGIESSAERIARGKPAIGTVSLNAYHDSGSVVIEVSDDGGGLKRERILAKGIERGVIAADAVLSDSEIFALAATAEEMSSQAEQLQSSMSFFRVDVAEARPTRAVPRKSPANANAAPPQKKPARKVTGNLALAEEEEPDESHFTKY